VAAIVLIAEGTNTFAGNSINLAVPRLMAHFGTDLAETQWVSTSFQIARTLVVPILGWLGALLGNRNLFVAMMVGFLISTVGCGLSSSLGMLIGFRLLQGLALEIGGYFIQEISWRLIFLWAISSSTEPVCSPSLRH
jgi:MFS family permease